MPTTHGLTQIHKLPAMTSNGIPNKINQMIPLSGTMKKGSILTPGHHQQVGYNKSSMGNPYKNNQNIHMQNQNQSTPMTPSRLAK